MTGTSMIYAYLARRLPQGLLKAEGRAVCILRGISTRHHAPRSKQNAPRAFRPRALNLAQEHR